VEKIRQSEKRNGKEERKDKAEVNGALGWGCSEAVKPPLGQVLGIETKGQHEEAAEGAFLK